MIWAGFLMGIFGSLHCIGMCGPIALVLPVHTSDKGLRLLAMLIYNAGRVVTYSVLGALLGMLGTAFYLAGLQQALSIISGSLLILLILFPIFFKNVFSGKTIAGVPYIQVLKHSIATRLRSHTFSSLFLIGLLNGLLPCGLVSIAVIGAVATGDVLQGTLYMLLFGLGTIPAMSALVFSKNYVPVGMKQIFQKVVPVFVCTLGVLLILRGMNLGIPYVSPSAEKNCCAQTTCH
ncbi:MAG: sulfite exporter TauE/SafE family protein [Cytophaga sp.]|uniref:sulfite exporter TauE/SafE family protein n=1 Tax=Cytophaga sp. TaxID=29535 RepID=UPI003F7FB524